jgi:hypothetical protein
MMRPPGGAAETTPHYGLRTYALISHLAAPTWNTGVLEMKRIRTRLIVIFIGGVMAVTAAMSLAEEPDELKDRARLYYKKTEAIPDNVFLPSFLNLLRVRYRGDLDRLAADVKDNLDIDDPKEAKDVASLLMEVSDAIDRDVFEYKRSTVCPSESAKPTGLEVYVALNSVDDARDEFGHEYLKTIEKELGEDRFLKFVAWMDRRKLSTTILRLDHAKTHEGEDPDVLRQGVCDTINASQTDRGDKQ